MVAIYPRELAPDALAALAKGRRVMHEFVEAAVKSGWITDLPIVGAEQYVFENWNTPDDVAGRH